MQTLHSLLSTRDWELLLMTVTSLSVFPSSVLVLCYSVGDSVGWFCRRRWVRRNRKGPVIVVANKTDGILDRSDGQVGWGQSCRGYPLL
jgi:hypothetical protein